MRQLFLKRDGQVLIERCFVAETFFSRFFGLMGRESLPVNEAILFPKCNSIHTLFMRFPLDVVMMDSDGRVVNLFEGIRPWRMTWPQSASKNALELAPGQIRNFGIELGQKLKWESAP